MIEFPSERWFVVSIGILFLIWAFAVFCFSRITVKYIENKMAEENKIPPEWDKGIGARLPAYSLVILFPNINKYGSLIDVKSTLRYARRVDWYLSLFVNVLSAFFFSVLFLGYYLHAPS